MVFKNIDLVTILMYHNRKKTLQKLEILFLLLKTKVEH